MARREFRPVFSGTSEEKSVEVFDYGNDSVIIVSREFANLIDPIGSGRAPVGIIGATLADRMKILKMAVKKS